MHVVTVGDLIDKLEKLPQDLQIVMSKDEEGNGYSPYIQVEKDGDQCVILYPGYHDDLSEVVDNYVEEEQE